MFILRSAAAAAKSKEDSTINAEDYALNTIVDDESTSEEDVTNSNLDANANANEEKNAEADDVDDVDEDAANEDDSNKNESLEMEEESEESDGSEEAEVESEASEGESEDIAAEVETVEAEAESETESAEDEGPQEEAETASVPPQDSPESNVEEEVAKGEGEDINDEASDEDSDAVSAEAEAISIATKAADENYQPSQSNLASSSPYPLIRSVDGIALKTYNTEPSRFSAKDVVIPLRGNLNVPIHVTTSGSIVDYTVECKDFDVGFGVIAEREEGVTVVKEKSRQNCHLNAITGRFLVGSVPCCLVFTFDNEYSWFREKKISYHIKVAPPSIENIVNGRRIRAKSALSVVQKDKDSAEVRLESVSAKYGTLLQDIERLETELVEKRKSLGVVEKEEGWLKQRVQLRDVQESLLTRRLVEGWEDEAAALARQNGESGDGDGDEDDDDDEETVQRAEI